MTLIKPKKNQLKFFAGAKKVSKNSDHRCRIGSVLVHENKIISAGCNQKFIFEDLTQRYNPEKALHSEIGCLLKLKNKQILKHCQMYVYRESLDGQLQMCRPCKGCQRILRSFGLSDVYYTSPEGFHFEQF